MKNAIHMLSRPGGAGLLNSFIIETKKQELVIIDGGWQEDAEHLLEYLKELSGEEKPRVAGWFLSHAHADHIDSFLEIMEKKPEAVEIGCIYYNFPSIQFVEKWEPDAADHISIRKFYRLLPKFADRTVIVTRGDRYDVGGAVFDILYSPNPVWTENAVNNTSVAMRMTLGGRTVMFLADMGVEAGRQLLEEYGETLKSDYCQMAHHGQNGVSEEVYRAIAPEACLWCTPDWLWNNDLGEGYNTASFRTAEVRGWMEALGVKNHYVMKDGDQRIVL